MGKDKEQLVLDNLNLAYSIAYKYRDKVPRTLDIDDVKQICVEGLIHAANTFDITRNNAFSTYAYTVIRNFLIDKSSQEYKRTGANDVSLDEVHEEDATLLNLIPDEFNLENHIIKQDNIKLLYYHIETLPTLQKEIMLLRCKNKTFPQIAQQLNKDDSYIHSQYIKALNMLRDKFRGDEYE